MSILSKVFSAGAGKLVQDVGNVIDNLHTSQEEKLAAEAKIKDLISAGKLATRFLTPKRQEESQLRVPIQGTTPK